MKFKNYIKIRRFLIIFILMSLFINIFNIFMLNYDNDQTTYSIETGYQGKPHTSGDVQHETQKIINPTFEDPIEPTWFWNVQGDDRDVKATTGQNQANFVVIGDLGEYEFAESPDETWEDSSNPEWGPLPNLAMYDNNYSTDDDGAFLTYTWRESVSQLGQLPSVQWKKTIPNVPVDMTDYNILSASLKVVFNATVTAEDHDGGGIDCPGDDPVPFDPDYQFFNGDFVRFYVRLSDPNNITRLTQAYNQSRYLGQDARADGYGKDHFTDSILSPSENRLIGDLEDLFRLNHTSLTIIIGINVFCEDNDDAYDWDYWDKLRIKYVNLTFTYEKRIDKRTSLSWNQEISEINGTNVIIKNANLRFNYKIDQNWTVASEFSQIKILINNMEHKDSVYLIDYIYSDSFQEAKLGGFDLDPKPPPYEKFNLSIQVYLAETFDLDRNITISITDVYLYVTWVENIPDIFPAWIFITSLIIAIIAVVGSGGYLIAYQKILKYPKPVRKVRKFRRTLRKDKIPVIPVISQKNAFKGVYKQELSQTGNLLKLKPAGQEMIPAKLKEESSANIYSPDQESIKATAQKLESDQLIAKSLEKKEELDKLVEKAKDK